AWTGLPGAPTTTLGGGEERDGTGGVDDYATTGRADIEPITPVIDKALVDTDQTTTADPDVTIGEVVTYDITVTLPEGNLDGFSVTDVLPSGLDFVTGSDEVFTSNGAAVPSPGLVADFDGTLGALTLSGGAGDGDDVVFDFAATTVNSDGDDTDNTIVVRIDAVVLDVASNVGFVPGQINLDNTASVQIDGGASITSGVVATPVVEPRLTILKSFDPTTASQGDTVTVEFAVENTGLGTAHDVIIEDALPAEFDESTAVEGTTPAGFTYSSSGNTITYTGGPLGSIAPGATIDFSFDVDLDAALPVDTVVINVATITQNTTLPGAVVGERDEPDVDGTAQLNTVGPDLILTKDDGVTDIAPGAQTTYDLVITNVGGFEATGVFILDTLPAGTTFVGIGGAGCADGGSPSTGVQRVDVAGAIAASGGTVTCQITIEISDPAAAGTGGYLNSATVGDDGVNGVDPTPANNTAEDNDTITGLAPDLVVTKDDSLTELAPGQTTTYRVTVTNVGNIGVTNALVTDTLPAGLTFADCRPVTGTVSIACSAAGPIVTISYSEIAGDGGSVSFDIDATVDEPVAAGNESVTNSVTVADDGSNGTDATPSNDTDTDTDDIVALPDMTIAKSHTEPNVAPGGVVTYRLDVSNVGAQNASGVVVTDTVDSQMTIDCGSASPTATTCDPGTGVITWGPGLQDGGASTLGEFVAGGTNVLTYTAAADNPVVAGTTEFVNDVTVVDDGTSGTDPTPGNNVARDTVPLNANAPDINIDKDDGQTVVNPGDTYDYDLTVTNTGNIAVTGVTISDTLPAGLEFVSCSDACDSSGLPDVTWALPGSIAGAGGTVTVTVTVTVTAPAAAGLETLTNVASVTDDGTNGPDATPADNIDDDADTVAAAPTLTISKDDGATERGAGEQYDYTIIVANTGDQAATGVTVTDRLPDALTAESCSATPTPCTIDAAAGTVTWAVGTLNGGASQAPPVVGSSIILTLTVLVNDLESGVTDFTNGVRVVDDGTNTGGVPVEAADDDTDTVNAAPDLQVTKSDNVTVARPGGTLTYDIVVTNVGSQAATGVTATDTLPTGVTFVSCSASCDESALPVLTWTDLAEDTPGSPVDPLAFDAGGQATLSVVVTVDDPAVSGLDSLTNSVSVTDDGTNGIDPTPGTNSAEDVDTLDAAPDLEITKTDGVVSVADGQTLTYQIAFSNIGDQDAFAVVITDTIAAETTFVSCSDGCDSSAAPLISWDVGTLPAGVGSMYTITVDVADPVPAGTRTVVNDVEITDDGTNGPDSDPGNNTDDDTDTYGVDLAVTKTNGQTTAVPGEDLEYTITVTNDGPTAITEFTLDEDLPAALNFVTFITSEGDYDPATGVWTDFGTFTEGEALTLMVSGTVSVDATGTLVNSVSVQPPVDVPDTDPTNNGADDVDTLEPRSNLTIRKTIDQSSIARGDDARYTISVTNTGPSTAVGVIVTDPLPSALTFVRASGTDWTCSEASRTVTCELGVPLSVGSTATFELVATVVGAEGTSFTNTATVDLPDGLGVDSDPSDTAGATIPETPVPDSTAPLPRTGGEIFRTLLLGLMLLLAGVFLVGFRRRSNDDAPA
ncbi:MAG: isopeptide-forming domain-containing fimbrial protein, partial [Ilumatobacter sp.]|uniref:beta strand repeat-containing protein n=1 Tax=Ilumatobacter sp. TaxID=1967498 RepID=UPI003C717C0E